MCLEKRSQCLLKEAPLNQIKKVFFYQIMGLCCVQGTLSILYIVRS